jgi:hypothetical protein
MPAFPVHSTFTFYNKLIHAMTVHRINICVLTIPCVWGMFIPACSQQNAQWIWFSPLTAMRIVGCVWVSETEVHLAPSHNAAATTALLLFATLHTSHTQPRTRSISLACTLALQISCICFSCVKCALRNLSETISLYMPKLFYIRPFIFYKLIA